MSAITSNLAEFVMKPTFVIIIVLLAVHFGLRRASAATRHLTLTLALVSLLVLPLLSLSLPVWQLEILPASSTLAAKSGAPSPARPVTDLGPSGGTSAPAARHSATTRAKIFSSDSSRCTASPPVATRSSARPIASRASAPNGELLTRRPTTIDGMSPTYTPTPSSRRGSTNTCGSGTPRAVARARQTMTTALFGGRLRRAETSMAGTVTPGIDER